MTGRWPTRNWVTLDKALVEETWEMTGLEEEPSLLHERGVLVGILPMKQGVG